MRHSLRGSAINSRTVLSAGAPASSSRTALPILQTCASNRSQKKDSRRRNPSIAAMGPDRHGSSGQTKYHPTSRP